MLKGLLLRVELSKNSKKSLSKAPRHIVMKFLAWVDLVETNGLEKARMRPGFHDEPLKGELRGKFLSNGEAFIRFRMIK